MIELTGLALVAAAAWFWFDSLRAHERALQVCGEWCERYGVQLLDQTVAIERLRLRRNPRGQMSLLRHYRFDFSCAGNDRAQGVLLLLGDTPILFELPGIERVILPA